MCQSTRCTIFPGGHRAGNVTLVGPAGVAPAHGWGNGIVGSTKRRFVRAPCYQISSVDLAGPSCPAPKHRDRERVDRRVGDRGRATASTLSRLGLARWAAHVRDVSAEAAAGRSAFRCRLQATPRRDSTSDCERRSAQWSRTVHTHRRAAIRYAFALGTRSKTRASAR